MKFLTNLCHPKQQHFEHEAKNQTYKQMNDYIFQNRNLDKIKLRNQANYHQMYNNHQQNNQYFSHPYSSGNRNDQINNFRLNQHQGMNMKTYNMQQGMSIKENHKLSFKDISQALCGFDKKQAHQYSYENQFYRNLNPNPERYDINNSRDAPYFVSTENKRAYHPIGNYDSRQSNLDKKEDLHNTSTYLQQLQGINKSMLLKQNQSLRGENQQLKRLIEEEYKPMKQLYTKLMNQQQQREYLITKLEWKVKELAKQVSSQSIFSQQPTKNNTPINNQTPTINRTAIKGFEVQQSAIEPKKLFNNNQVNTFQNAHSEQMFISPSKNQFQNYQIPIQSQPIISINNNHQINNQTTQFHFQGYPIQYKQNQANLYKINNQNKGSNIFVHPYIQQQQIHTNNFISPVKIQNNNINHKNIKFNQTKFHY